MQSDMQQRQTTIEQQQQQQQQYQRQQQQEEQRNNNKRPFWIVVVTVNTNILTCQGQDVTFESKRKQQPIHGEKNNNTKQF